MYSCRVLILLWAWLVACTLSETDHGGGHVSRATAAELSVARGIVERAQTESAKLNGARMDNPARNRYWAGRKGWVAPPPLLDITPEIARAATIVSDAEGALPLGDANGTSAGKRDGGFWMETLSRKGTVPWGDDPKYQVCACIVLDLIMYLQLKLDRSFEMSSILALIRME